MSQGIEFNRMMLDMRAMQMDAMAQPKSAVQAPAELGAPSFSDIFSGNAFKNGILTVVLPQEQVDRLMEVAQTDPLTIDLAAQTVTSQFQDRFSFDIDAFRKHCLLNGLDEVGLTLAKDAAISSYETHQAADMPWFSKGTALAA